MKWTKIRMELFTMFEEIEVIIMEGVDQRFVNERLEYDLMIFNNLSIFMFLNELDRSMWVC
jgi:hypothetical protein